MNGGTGKMGRGGGNAGKRNIHAPPINRASSTGRTSMSGGPRSRAGASSAVISSPSTSALQVEESFSLVRENPLNFGMAIKLAPDLVEEIKRVAAQGGTSRIKFDSNANNPYENVIHVGDKSFKFTWSREPGDLCDIYEERQSGEDGNGLLVESGGTWRKLNVERELDESTKNHVKRLSEEAERKQKSRKAIVLDHQNPSMKNRMKAIAASESNQWRNAKNRKEPPFKKPRSEPPSGGLPPSVYKSASSTVPILKGNLSSPSPLSSQQEQHSASPLGNNTLLRGHTVLPDIVPPENINRALGLDKEAHTQLGSVRDKSKHNQNIEAKPSDLRSLMVSLLQENQGKGMSLKALEKAIRDAMPNSARQIEPILKQVANFQAPGRYFLKPEVEMEKSNKPLSQSRRSPEISHRQVPGPKKFVKLPAQDPSFVMRSAANKEHNEFSVTPVHATESIEKIDILSNSPEHLNEKKASNNGEGLVGTSSDSGSGSYSDSDSSDSDSGSHSKSKNRSPVGSGSGSSTDSGSDASSSGKHASDEDVDIMTSDNDKENASKLQGTGHVSSKSPIDIGNYGKYDAPVSVVDEIEKSSPLEGHHTASVFHNEEGEEPVERIKLPSMNHHEQDEGGDRVRNAPDSEVDDGFQHVQPSSHQISKDQPKRQFDHNYSDERIRSRKRLKSKNSSHPVSGTLKTIFGDSPSNSSPDSLCESLGKGTANVITKQTAGDGTNDTGLQAGFNQVIATRPMPDIQQLCQKSSEACESANPPSGGRKQSKHDVLGPAGKYSQKNIQPSEDPWLQSAYNADMPSENGLITERLGQYPLAVGDKHSTMLGNSPKNNSTQTKYRSHLMNGQDDLLQRQHSDFELGELRDPLLDETPGPKKLFERKSSIKQLENSPMDSECRKPDFKKGKPSNKRTAMGKISPQNQEAMISSTPDRPSKKKSPDHYANDHIRVHSKSTLPLHQHQQPLGDQNEVETQPCKVLEINGKGRSGEGGGGPGPRITDHGGTSAKVCIDSIEQRQDRIQVVGSHITKDGKLQKPDMVDQSNGRRKGASMRGSNGPGPKRKETSDGNGCSFTKYEKEEPELKCPIKDVSQYQDYVKEYQEKYESYSSLNKILESYRSEFDKLGKELEANKGRDMKRYFDILGQMRSSFRQCGEKHKRLKKIFLLLHEELKHLKQMIRDFAASYKKI